MSSCGNCDCADKSQCTKKGNGYDVVIVNNENSYFDEVVTSAAEHDPNCKCGASCTCADCSCGK